MASAKSVKVHMFLCTTMALASGALGFAIGDYLSLRAQPCQTQAWGLRHLCQIGPTGASGWTGGLVGLTTGAILGAGTAGRVTRSRLVDGAIASQPFPTDANGSHRDWSVLFPRSPEVQFTATQREALQCALVLLAILPAQQEGVSELVSPELKAWAEGSIPSQALPYPLDRSQAQRLLRELGFSRQAIADAWGIVKDRYRQ